MVNWQVHYPTCSHLYVAEAANDSLCVILTILPTSKSSRFIKIHLFKTLLNLLRDEIKLFLPLSRNTPSFLARLDPADLSKLPEDDSNNLSTCLAEVAWGGSIVLLGSISVLELFDGCSWMKINLACD